ncbi:MAG: hypothetical protein ORN21_01190 [Methylophilaceae bacterium]|nr:hypothetical protein [Methylophilaceae bacterium]
MSQRLLIDSLKAEKSAIEELLEQAFQWNDPIGKAQFARKKEVIDAKLAKLIENPEKKASLVLFFGGEPVMGSRGISADFAGNILDKFQELVNKFYARAEIGTLSERGPVPLQHSANLMITQVAKGSFGFVLDELSDHDELLDTSLKTVVEEVASTIKKTASINDLDFEDVIDSLDHRTLIALRDLFVDLDKNSATIRLLEEKFDYTLDHPSIQRGRRRTESTEIDEKEETIFATLQGFLPEHKKFEGRYNDESIYGSASKQAAEEIDRLIRSEEAVFTKNWELKVIHKTITPLNRPPKEIYKLLELVRRVD